ncbi:MULTISPECIES: hypothetical protein [Burkholderia]|uniref:hypothetical protein n=1 Tax=Burkholderia TaxID=32008 RepID=UPI000AACB6BA|nr:MULTISPECIES: hypothetical protein [Burkholderia]
MYSIAAFVSIRAGTRFFFEELFAARRRNTHVVRVCVRSETVSREQTGGAAMRERIDLHDKKSV